MTRFSLVPAAYVLLRRGPEVLLQFRQGTGYMDGHWSFSAAGHVERGESVHAAGVRETLEELGVTVVESDLVPVCTMHRRQEDGHRGQSVDFFFACSEWEGTPHVTEPHRSGGLQWARLDALPTPIVPYVKIPLGMLNGDDPNCIVHHGF